jgi:thymidylate kinase
MGGFTVVCDRFIHDNLVELMVDARDDKLHEKLIGQLLLKLKPEPSEVFLLDINESFAYQRKLDLPNLNYVIQRKSKYHLIANRLHIPIINAERPLLVVYKEIMNKLGA